MSLIISRRSFGFPFSIILSYLLRPLRQHLIKAEKFRNLVGIEMSFV